MIAAPHDDVEDDEGSGTGGERRHGGTRWRAAAHADAVLKGGRGVGRIVVVLVWWLF